jgi:hypothetical protein
MGETVHFPPQCPANPITAPAKVGFDLAPINLKHCGGWTSFITTIVAELWLRTAREREISRMRAAWVAIGDRALRDIGVFCWKMAFAAVRHASGWRYEGARLCNQATGRVSAGPGWQLQAAFSECPVL